MVEGYKSVYVVYVFETEGSRQLCTREFSHKPVVTGRGGKEKGILCLCDL